MNSQTRTSSYDSKEYPFTQVVLDLYKKHLTDKIDDLAHLHEALVILNVPAPNLVDVNTDQSTLFHKTFYEHMHEEFLPLYLRFIKEFVRPLYGEAMVYQTVPSFRVALPENLATGEFHRDSDYNHAKEAINFWVPLTKVFGTNALWVESTEGKEDYAPQELSVGQYLIFSGVLLKHGNKINKTGKTRVSFDLRTIPLAEYKESGKSTVTQHKKLVIGEYFSVCE